MRVCNLRQILLLLLWATSPLFAHNAAAADGAGVSIKASEWVGRVVVTTQGELLGRVEDFALDLEQHRIKYIVVSVGSFLIDDNLVAVEPSAIGPAEEGNYLVLYSDDLDTAARFGAGDWPDMADVTASAMGQAKAPDDVPESSQDGFEQDGVATISDGRRTATMKSGDRNMTLAEPVASSQVLPQSAKSYPPGADPADLVLPDFERLDQNDDGKLSRREIGPRLARDESFAELDVDDSGALDSFEYERLVQARASSS